MCSVCNYSRLKVKLVATFKRTVCVCVFVCMSLLPPLGHGFTPPTCARTNTNISASRKRAHFRRRANISPGKCIIYSVDGGVRPPLAFYLFLIIVGAKFAAFPVYLFLMCKKTSNKHIITIHTPSKSKNYNQNCRLQN